VARLAKPITVKPSTAVESTLSDAVAAWRISLDADNKSPRTIGQYAYALDVAAYILGPNVSVGHIRPEHIDRLIVALKGRGWKPATVSTVERPLRTFLKWCVGRGHIERSPMDGRKPVTVPVEPVVFPSPEDMRRVLATCQSRSRFAFRARRDRAILLLFATTGVRLAELSSLRLNDVNLTGPLPNVTVMGKGRKVRTLPLDDTTAEAIRAYLQSERPRSPFSSVSDRLWLASKGPMTHSGVAQMVADRAATVGVNLHPHALRHYAIDQLLRVMSEGDTMQVTGHTTRSMLSRYGAALAAERADEAFRATAGRRAAL
jgi:integrase